MPATVTLFYDVVSPYSWLGFEAAIRFKKIWGYNLVLRPFFLGGIMNESGNKPPATNPYKGKHMINDLRLNDSIPQLVTISGHASKPAELTLLSKLHGVPLQFPSNFPQQSLKAQRVLVAIQQKEPSLLEEASRQLWRLYWKDGQDLESDAALIQYLTPVLNARAETFVNEHTKSADVKQALLQSTREALEAGAFGAPWWVVEREDGTKECFFGSDRMEVLAFFLGKNYPGIRGEAAKL
ncbi:Glutathione S-transferase kappa 1 [Phlyctochytrium bullatum]|nr:Glutathione S-transferase kappa 1 [Phlyctochytrium bullatum]